MDKSLRPSIRPALVAQLIDQAPSRVRKRLDKDPAVADTWDWSLDATGVSIIAGEETVRLELDRESKSIMDAGQVSCSCLLSPKCFHLLACASVLPIDQSEASRPQPLNTKASSDPSTDVATIEITDAMRNAARRGMDAIDAVLRSGARVAAASCFSRHCFTPPISVVPKD